MCFYLELDIADIDLSAAASGGTAPYTFAATGLPTGITISAAGVISGTPTAVAEAGTATVTVEDSSSPKQSKQITIAAGAVAANPKYDAGVVINGVTWATRAVGMPGTFADAATDAGMFYQWNRIMAWSNTEPLKAYNTDGEEIVDEVWPSYTDFGTSWLPANDPSPAGWRVPTKAELRSLLNTAKVSSEWVAATETTPAGRKFTDIATGNSIFFYAGGTRSSSSPNTGKLTRVGEGALWWGGFERYRE